MGGLGSVPLPPCHQHGDLVLADTQTEREARCSAAWASHNPSNQWCSANFVIFWPLGAESFMGARGGPRPFLPPPLPAHPRRGSSPRRACTCAQARPQAGAAAAVPPPPPLFLLLRGEEYAALHLGTPVLGGKETRLFPPHLSLLYITDGCACVHIFMYVYIRYIYIIYILCTLQ